MKTIRIALTHPQRGKAFLSSTTKPAVRQKQDFCTRAGNLVELPVAGMPDGPIHVRLEWQHGGNMFFYNLQVIPGETAEEATRG